MLGHKHKASKLILGRRCVQMKRRPLPTGATPDLTKGTASIELAGGAKKTSAAKPEALEPGALDEAGRGHETPLEGDANREIDTPPQGERELKALPLGGWHIPKVLPQKGVQIDALP